MMRHIWIIGDELLDTMANSFRKLKTDYIFDASKPQMDILKDFHVEPFNDSEIKPTYKNILRKVRNNLTIAMNKFPQVLPCYVVILLNNNMIHDSAFVDFELKHILKKMLNDVGRLLSTRKDQIPHKYRSTWGDTQVFVTRPLPKPAILLAGDQHFKNSRRQVNAMLDKLALTYDFTILNVDSINSSQKALFEKGGQLSDFGKEKFWMFISEFLQAKHNQMVSAITKAHATKHDVGIQVDGVPVAKQSSTREPMPRNGNNYDKQYNFDNAAQYQDFSRADAQQRYARPQFDEYHTRYDRTDYRAEARHGSQDRADFYHRTAKY